MRTTITPRVTKETLGFWEGCRAGQLRVQRCGGCGTLRFPPQPMCPRCRSRERAWVPVRGTGRIYTYSVVTGLGSEPQLPGEHGHPYAVAVVELDEGVRMVTDVDTEDVDRLAIGVEATVVFERVDDEITLPRFALGPPRRDKQTE